MATKTVILAAVNGDSLVDNAAEDVTATVTVRDTTPTRSSVPPRAAVPTRTAVPTRPTTY
jgi:hypothetical protein